MIRGQTVFPLVSHQFQEPLHEGIYVTAHVTDQIFSAGFQASIYFVEYSARLRPLIQISFHTLGHYKATMEYHKTKDILHVMQILGHRNINSNLVYTHLVDFKDDDYTAKVAHSEQEVC
jgi:integrase